MPTLNGSSGGEDARRSLTRAIRAAGRAHSDDGWQAKSNGLVMRAPEGAWARIWVDVPSVPYEPVPVSVYAGTASPYLLRVVNHLDPEKPPPAGYLHAIVLWQYECWFRRDAATEPTPLSLPQPAWTQSRVVIGDTTALSWLEGVYATLVPVLRGLCTELAIRDWLVATAPPYNYLDMRYAVLLTRSLGLTAQLPGLVDDAERLKAAAEDFTGERSENDRDSNMLMWSNERFRRYVNQIPPT